MPPLLSLAPTTPTFHFESFPTPLSLSLYPLYMFLDLTLTLLSYYTNQFIHSIQCSFHSHFSIEKWAVQLKKKSELEYLCMCSKAIFISFYVLCAHDFCPFFSVHFWHFPFILRVLYISGILAHIHDILQIFSPSLSAVLIFSLCGGVFWLCHV